MDSDYLPPESDDAEPDAMDEFTGRWIYKPLIIAVATVFAVGLLATLAGLQNTFPPWAYTLPALPTVSIYYALESKKVYNLHFGNQTTTNQDASGGAQAVSVQGNRNTTIIHTSNAGSGGEDEDRRMENEDQMRFRDRHEQQLGPLMKDLETELKDSHEVIDGTTHWTVNELTLSRFGRQLASHQGMPGLGMAIAHAESFGLNVRSVRDCIQDITAFIEVRDELTQSLRALVAADPDPWSVQVRTNEQQLSAKLLYHVILGGPNDLEPILRIHTTEQGGTLVLPDGTGEIAEGTTERMQTLHAAVITNLQQTTDRIMNMRGHTPGQPDLLESVNHWRQYLRELLLGFGRWHAHGIRSDRCHECKERLPILKPPTIA